MILTAPHSSSTARGALVLAATVSVAVLLTTGCKQPPATPAQTKLEPLDAIPAFDIKPVQWSVSRRARILADDAGKAMGKGDCSAAASKLVESVTLDPSLTSARLSLARVYARCGVPVTALKVLEQLVANSETSGGCREAIIVSRSDAALAPLWKTAKGQALRKKLGALDVPLQKWATDIAADLAKGKAAALSTLIHPKEPWQLIRSCPECLDEKRRKPEKRQLFGFNVAQKLAARFQPDARALGAVPLVVAKSVTCAGRCCQWKAPDPLPAGKAVLSMVCLRPITPKQGALTRLEIVYGRPLDDVEAAKHMKAAPDQNGRRRVVYMPGPATATR